MRQEKRTSGVLLHISSLPSAYAVGDMGKDAYAFLYRLKEAGQGLWQVLPLQPLGFGGSPYQSNSAFALEPLYISLELLAAKGLLAPEDLPEEVPFGKADYALAKEVKYPCFRQAFAAFSEKRETDLALDTAYRTFLQKEAYWLEDYCLFSALQEEILKERAEKEDTAAWEDFLAEAEGSLSEEAARDHFRQAVWVSWPKALQKRQPAALRKAKKRLEREMAFTAFLQFIAHSQWRQLQDAAAENNIKIIGDVPIFVSYDSADVWAHRGLFQLDSKGFPLAVAGVPPDYFSQTGQLWGNPLYDWAKHAKEGYRWWTERMRHMLASADLVRLDHFRGFESYWSIPFGAKTAQEGKWEKGPADAFFAALEKELGTLPLIAEDLGIITQEVAALRERLKLPGMRILQFAFGQDPNHIYLPHRYEKNTVVYTGTHDNDTIVGWYASAAEKEKDHFRRYLNVSGDSPAWDMIRLAMSSVADMAVFPLQDVLELDSGWRMNTPGTVENNWRFRFQWQMWQEGYTNGLRYLSELFGRMPQEKAQED